MNWRWPAKQTNYWQPWYTIIWRCLWAPIIFVGLGFLLLGVAISFGPREARNVFDQL